MGTANEPGGAEELGGVHRRGSTSAVALSPERFLVLGTVNQEYSLEYEKMVGETGRGPQPAIR